MFKRIMFLPLLLSLASCVFSDDNTGAIRPEIEDPEPEVLEAFVTVWATDKAGVSKNTEVKLPLIEKGGAYDFTVDWGDGSSDGITQWNAPEATHTYTIRITGSIEGWSFNPSGTTGVNKTSGDSAKLLEVKNWGALLWGATWGHFYGTTNLKITALDSPDLSKTTALRGSFARSGIINPSHINDWDLSTITDMFQLFYEAEQFDGDISQWKFPQAIILSYMFAGAQSFNGDLSQWEFPEVNSMGYMFYKAERFNGDISQWNFPKVTDMINMFNGATAFNSDIAKWTFPEVDSMNGMFGRTETFNVDISGWKFPKVTDMTNMFYFANAFDQDLSNWDLAGIDHDDMLFGCPVKTQPAKHPQNYVVKN